MAATGAWPDACETCHRENAPGLYRQGANSKHGAAGVSCIDCHAAEAGDADAFDHYLAPLVPFDREEYYLAREIALVVPEGEVVGNFRGDGSTWAWHVSGREFLNPMSWECRDGDGTNLIASVLGLQQDPCPNATRKLEKRGVRWVYVSDNRLRDDQSLEPEDFEGDPRFTLALERAGTRLLRINWEVGKSTE